MQAKFQNLAVVLAAVCVASTIQGCGKAAPTTPPPTPAPTPPPTPAPVYIDWQVDDLYDCDYTCASLNMECSTDPDVWPKTKEEMQAINGTPKPGSTVALDPACSGGIQDSWTDTTNAANPTLDYQTHKCAWKFDGDDSTDRCSEQTPRWINGISQDMSKRELWHICPCVKPSKEDDIAQANLEISSDNIIVAGSMAGAALVFFGVVLAVVRNARQSIRTFPLLG